MDDPTSSVDDVDTIVRGDRDAAQNTEIAELADVTEQIPIRITDDEELNTLNLKYRGIDKITDVLSFPADFEDPDLGSRYVGDVVIAFPRAEEQAQKRGHFVEAEIQLLVVHGTLHLLGYDHGDKTEKEEMWLIPISKWKNMAQILYVLISVLAIAGKMADPGTMVISRDHTAGWQRSGMRFLNQVKKEIQMGRRERIYEENYTKP